MNTQELATLRKLSNETLLQQTQDLVREERKLGIRILHRLKEIERRRLHCKLGYASLFTYGVKELRYPESTMYRLIQAMRLMTEIPEVERKIESGVLSVTTASQVQAFCKESAPDEKRAVLEAVEGQSKREVERTLFELRPEAAQPAPAEKEKRVSKDQVQIQIVASERLLQKLKRIKDLTAHRKWDPSYAELFEMLADAMLERVDPERKPKRGNDGDCTNDQGLKKKAVPIRHSQDNSLLPPVEVPRRKTAPPFRFEPHPPTARRSRYIRAAARREIWQRSGGQCMYTSPLTGQRCQETRGLELDHVVPFGKGGGNTSDNLALVCRAHNLERAVESYGMGLMGAYLKRRG